MKILWLCNIVLPELCDEFGFKRVNVGGWLTGMWQELSKNDTLEMAICVPIKNRKCMRDGRLRNYQYYSFGVVENCLDLPEQENRFREILEDFQPDIIHIWGTEYFHSYTMVQAAKRGNCIQKVLVHIQGLISVCALYYGFGIPNATLIEKKGGSSIADEILDFKMRGEYEVELLKCVQHVAGRTDWDRGCALQISPLVTYHQCREVLREEFYINRQKWDVERCERHSIFISQASYPVKGFHLILGALSELAKKYRDLRVYISGSNLLEMDTPYAALMREEIIEHHLEKIINFVGMCTDRMMYQYYLKANVFLLASTIENSSNSVCEAMRVGVPIVSSYVGGIPSLLIHKQTGLLYPLGESSMIQYYIEQIFENDRLALLLSENSIMAANQWSDREKVVSETLQIYEKISREE